MHATTREVRHAEPPEMVLSVGGLKKRYGKVVALTGVSISIPKGSVVALLGPNGAGKTTLIEILLGLRTPDAGSVTLMGVDILKNPRACQEKIGVQLQDTRLHPKLRVKDALKLFASFYQHKADIAAIARLFGLDEQMKRPIARLSGGWQQRVALALALVNDPEFLILDEPTTGLDPLARREVWSLLRSLRSKGRTILLSTHFMEEAEQLADEIILLSKGSVIATGTHEQLKSGMEGAGATLEDVYIHLVQQHGGGLGL